MTAKGILFIVVLGYFYFKQRAILPATVDNGLAFPQESRGASLAVTKAVADLASRLQIAGTGIRLVRVQAVEWPDASFGCPLNDSAYALAVTPGYRITLEFAGVPYEYRADLAGTIRSC